MVVLLLWSFKNRINCMPLDQKTPLRKMNCIIQNLKFKLIKFYLHDIKKYKSQYEGKDQV